MEYGGLEGVEGEWVGVEGGSCSKLLLYPGGRKCLIWLKEDPINSPKCLGDKVSWHDTG